MNRAGGVVAAVAANAAALAVAFAIGGVTGGGGGEWPVILGNIVPVIVFGTPLALAVALLAGLPLAIRLERHNRTRALHFLLLGLVLGMLPFLVYDAYVVAYELLNAWRHGLGDERWGLQATLRRLAQDVPHAAITLGMGAWCGAWSALAYWWIAVRPTQDPG